MKWSQINGFKSIGLSHLATVLFIVAVFYTEAFELWDLR